VTREQGEALLAYIDAALAAAAELHLWGSHQAPPAGSNQTDEQKTAARDAFRALLP
jgi:hypothetical protein